MEECDSKYADNVYEDIEIEEDKLDHGRERARTEYPTQDYVTRSKIEATIAAEMESRDPTARNLP